MGKKCFIPNCKSGYDSNKEKITVFGAPKDEITFKMWQKVIPRKDRTFSKTDYVCEKHFKSDDIISEWTDGLNTIPLGRRRLKLEAFPTIFPNSPKNLSTKSQKRRKIKKQEIPTKKKSLLNVVENTQELENNELDIGTSLEMVGCCAFGCSNRSEKGFLMKAFPTNPERRKMWTDNVKRENWTPSNSSRLCEVHFAPEMWEKTREDGKRALRCNAVPTIFSYTSPKCKRKTPVKRKVLATTLTPDNKTTCTLTMKTENEATSTISSLLVRTESLMKENVELNIKLQQYDRTYRQLFLVTKNYKNQIRCLKRKIKNSKPKDDKLLRSIFNDDQILALRRNSTKFMKWSYATMMKAIKLKFSCGISGYKELLKQKIPLPSLRTLSRHFEQ